MPEQGYRPSVRLFGLVRRFRVLRFGAVLSQVAERGAEGFDEFSVAADALVQVRWEPVQTRFAKRVMAVRLLRVACGTIAAPEGTNGISDFFRCHNLIQTFIP